MTMETAMDTDQDLTKVQVPPGGSLQGPGLSAMPTPLPLPPVPAPGDSRGARELLDRAKVLAKELSQVLAPVALGQAEGAANLTMNQQFAVSAAWHAAQSLAGSLP